MPTRLVGLASMVLALATMHLPAQETPAEVDVSALARRVRNPQSTDDERSVAVDGLLAAGDRGASALLEAIAYAGAPVLKEFRAEAARVRAGFERRARTVLQKRMGRDGDRRVGTLRFEILQRSRSVDLSKEIVVSEIDPRVAELRTLLVLEPSVVLAATPVLSTQLERARAHAAWLVKLWECRVRADAALQSTAFGLDLLMRKPAFPDPRKLVEDLDADLVALADRATPMSDRDARTLQANEALQDGIDVEEKAGVRELNRIRVLLGLSVLAIDVQLCTAARDHSADMVKLAFFSHDSPVTGKENPGLRAQKAGTSASAENIASGVATGAEAIRVWWYSPGHHRNMLRDAMRVGLGRSADHWTQLFGN